MATRRRVVSSDASGAIARRPRDPNSASPAQHDEADILAEVGAEADDTGELVADEGKIREIGAVDAASVITNRRMKEVADKRRAHIKGVSFNTDDLLEQYEVAIKTWPPNTLDITVKRTTGTPITRTITSHPRSGIDLYEALRILHGPCEEAEYEVKCLDANGKQYRCIGRITMPDARPAQSQQGQQPVVYPPPGYPQQPAPAQPAPQQTPQAAALDPNSMLTTMQQMIDMVDRMRAVAQPTPPTQVWQPPPQTPQMPAPPPPGASPADMMTWMQQMVGMVDQMRSATAQATPQFQPPPPPAPTSPQSGMLETMTMMEQMFKMFQRMQGTSPSAAPAPARGPFSRPAYGDRGEDPRYPPQREPPPPPPPQREKSPAEQIREAMTSVRSVMSVVQEMSSLLPGQEPQEAPQVEENAPVRIIDTGVGKLVMDAGDGSLRKWETALTALPGVMKWIGEQREEIQKRSQQRQQQQQQPRQQLPPGFVEVTEDYNPPPGFVAVAVDEHDLPPPPEETPPPIDSSPEGRRSWG